MKIQVRQARDKQWFVRLVARNGRVVFNTETYTRKSGAIRIAHRLSDLLGEAVRVLDVDGSQ